MAIEVKSIKMTGNGFLYSSYMAFANISSILGLEQEAQLYLAKAQAAATTMNQQVRFQVKCRVFSIVNYYVDERMDSLDYYSLSVETPSRVSFRHSIVFGLDDRRAC